MNKKKSGYAKKSRSAQKRVKQRRAAKRAGRSPAELPSNEQIKAWVHGCIVFYTGFEDPIEDDFKILEDPLNMDPANLVDLAGTLRHGVKNYNPAATVLAEDLDDETVGSIVALVTSRIGGVQP